MELESNRYYSWTCTAQLDCSSSNPFAVCYLGNFAVLGMGKMEIWVCLTSIEDWRLEIMPCISMTALNCHFSTSIDLNSFRQSQHTLICSEHSLFCHTGRFRHPLAPLSTHLLCEIYQAHSFKVTPILEYHWAQESSSWTAD